MLKFSDSESFCTWGSQKRFIPNLNTWGFGAIFEIYGKLTSPSEPTSCLCPGGAIRMIQEYEIIVTRIWCLGRPFLRKSRT